MNFEELLTHWRSAKEDVKFKRTTFNPANFILDREGILSTQTNEGVCFIIYSLSLEDLLFEKYEILDKFEVEENKAKVI